VVLALAIIIELYDKYSEKGTAEIMDIIYTLAGCICVLIINLINI